MARWWKTSACERARQWISLELDGELSELEGAALARHLDSCLSCRALGADLRAFTRLLREARPVALERPLPLPARARARVRTAARRAAASLALAGVAAAAVLGGIVVAGSGGHPPSALSFRSAQEQRVFASVEARRIEPAVFVTAARTVQSFASRALV